MKSIITSGKKRAVLLAAYSLIGTAVSFAQTIAETTDKPADNTSKNEVIHLSPFEVHGGDDSSYSSKNSGTIGRVRQDLDDVPQKVVNLPRVLLDDTGVIDYRDILNYTTGVQPLTGATYGAMQSYIRGFNSGLPLRNGQIVGSFNPASGDTDTIENVEVVKGATSILYGESRPGGIINYTTKEPSFKKATVLQLRAYDTGGYAAMIDSKGPLVNRTNENKFGLAYRLVLKNEERDLFTGSFLNNRVAFAKIRSEFSDKIVFKAEFEYVLKTTQFLAAGSYLPFSADIGSINKVLPKGRYDRELRYESDDAFVEFDNRTFQGDLTVNLAKDSKIGTWDLRGMLVLNPTRLNAIQGNFIGGGAKVVTATMVGNKMINGRAVSTTDVGRGYADISYIHQEYGSKRQRVGIDLLGHFATGRIDHTLLVGSSKDQGLSSWNNGVEIFVAEGVLNSPLYPNGFGGGTTNATRFSTYLDEPDNRRLGIDPNDIFNLTLNPDGKLFRNTAPESSDTLDRTDFDPTNLYIVDNVRFWDGKVTLSLGWRRDELLSGVQTLRPGPGGNVIVLNQVKFTNDISRIGVVVKPRDWMSAYALYNESFILNFNVPYNAAPPRSIPFPPQNGIHKEIGTRFDLFAGRAAIDISYYDITLTNIAVQNPVANPDGTVSTYFIDGVRNRGVEASATVALTRGFQMIGTWEHNNGQIADDPINPANIGKPMAKNAENVVKLWGKYSVEQGKLKGLSIGAGYRYQGSLVAVDPTTRSDAVTLPSYTIVDFMVGYQLRNWQIQANIGNVFDELGYTGGNNSNQIYSVAPRNCTLTFRRKF